MSFFTFAAINLVLVGIGAMIAYKEGRFNKQQMGEVFQNMPWTCHGGSWADLIIVTLLFGIIGPYWSNWSVSAILTCVAVSLAITVIAHIFWVKTADIPGHLTDPYRGLTAAGWYHIPYMILALTGISLFYTSTSQASLGTMILVSVLLTIFIWPALIQPGIYVNEITDKYPTFDLTGKLCSSTALSIIWAAFYLNL